MIIMNQAGEVLLAQGVQFVGIDDPLIAEMLTLREAICWCLASVFMEVRLEGDAKVVIDKINRSDTTDSQIRAFSWKLCNV
ncbi:unnamed protein product [Linum trigynum]|uniref:RNase H type-1 domain-containing protein n=1 Tax=Linum trigynum TaxID=586398 RepID=A0AAV2F3R9_9ROSI